MSDEEVVDSAEPEIIEEDALFLDDEVDDLGLDGELGEEDDLGFKLGSEEE